MLHSVPARAVLTVPAQSVKIAAERRGGEVSEFEVQHLFRDESRLVSCEVVVDLVRKPALRVEPDDVPIEQAYLRRNMRLDVERLFTDARVKVGTMLQMIHCRRCEGLPYGEPVIPGGLD